MTAPARFVILTGLSGGGKTQALRFLEDQGFFCVDNLPATLLPTFAQLINSAESPHPRVAVCVDARAEIELAKLPEHLRQITALGFRPQLVFLDADDATLHKRYSESRRPHPASPAGSIEEGIAHEREILGPVRERADVVIDTSNLNPGELRNHIAALALHGEPQKEMRVSLLTFGYKHGLPKEADLVIDVRFLPNPHYDEALRPRDGRDAEVRSFVLDNEDAQAFLYRLTQLLEFLVPRYAAEPKSYLTLAIGCTGGRHRSVAIAEELAIFLTSLGYPVTIKHRDVALTG